MAALPLSSLANAGLSVLSAGRMLVGVSTLFAPESCSHLFGVATDHPSSNIIYRMLGIREIVLASFLWRARTNLTSAVSAGNVAAIAQGRRSLRDLIWMGVAVDAVDIGSTAVAVMGEGMGGRAEFLFGGGAAAFIGLGMAAVRRL